jgi:hypothetical protein
MGPRSLGRLGNVIENSQPCGRHDGFVSSFIVNRSLKFMVDRRDWGDSLEIVQSNYLRARNDTMRDSGVSARGFQRIRSRMSAADADLILSNPERYPIILIAMAESRREQHEQSLYAVARDRRWFEQEY